MSKRNPRTPSLVTTATLSGMVLTLVVSMFARASCDFQLAGRVSEAPRLVQVTRHGP